MPLDSLSSCAVSIPAASIARKRCSPSAKSIATIWMTANRPKPHLKTFLKHYPRQLARAGSRKAIAEIDNPSAAKSPFKAKAHEARSRPAGHNTLRAAEAEPKDARRRRPSLRPMTKHRFAAAQSQPQDVAAVSTDCAAASSAAAYQHSPLVNAEITRAWPLIWSRK